MKQKTKRIVIILLITIAIILLITGLFLLYLPKENMEEKEILIENEQELKNEVCYKTLCIDKIIISNYKEIPGKNVRFEVLNKGESTIEPLNLEIVFDDLVVRKFDTESLKPGDNISISTSINNEELKTITNYT